MYVQAGLCPFSSEVLSKITQPESTYEDGENIWISSILFMIVRPDEIKKKSFCKTLMQQMLGQHIVISGKENTAGGLCIRKF